MAAEAGAYPSVPPPRGPVPSLIGFLNLLLRNLGIFLSVFLGTVVLVILLHVTEEDVYRAYSSFMPNVPQQSDSRLRGLAADFGVNLGAAQQGESLFFYGKLLKSRDLLEEAANQRYPLGEESDERVPLDRIFGVDPSLPPADRLNRTVDILSNRITVVTDGEAGTVGVETVAEYPEVAEELNRSLLELVNRFNLERRQSRAAAEKEFVEARLSAAQQELEEAEERLRAFLNENRRYQGSPDLQFEGARLERRVEMRQQIVSSLAQSFEQARIEEVRNTPVITFIDTPEGTARPAGRGLIVTVVLGSLLGFVLALGTVLAVEHLRREKNLWPDRWEEFRTLRSRFLPGAFRG